MMDLSKYDFEALIFDCDGTIADTMPLHYVSWVYALNENHARFPFTKDTLMSMAGIGLIDTVKILNRKHSHELDPEKVAADKERYYREHLDQTGAIPEVIAIIENYRGKLPMSVASGSNRDTVHRTLKQLNLLDDFDAIVTQDDIMNGKPAPDLFLLAAEKMGIPANVCLVFEDSDLGIQAAEAAGMAWVKIQSRL